MESKTYRGLLKVLPPHKSEFLERIIKQHPQLRDQTPPPETQEHIVAGSFDFRGKSTFFNLVTCGSGNGGNGNTHCSSQVLGPQKEVKYNTPKKGKHARRRSF